MLMCAKGLVFMASGWSRGTSTCSPWGISPREMKKRIERLNREILLPIADGLAAAHQKRISRGKLPSKIAYVLKSPRKAYRLYKWDTITPDGEIVPKFKQKKTISALGNV
jgi:hypothetical protein